jgi:prolyl 4-hydroxylase
MENGGQRVATVLIYLSTPEEGGETVFPLAEKKVIQVSDCMLA